MKIAIGVSGSGTTMEAIAKAIISGELDLDLAFVFADRECRATEKAKKLSTCVVQKKASESTTEFHKRVVAKAGKEKVDIIVLAGYLKLFPVLRSDTYIVINSHPAAIPEFGGVGFWGIRAHETVLNFARATNFRHPYTYSTIHVASAEYDKGDILGIVQMEIKPTDTPEFIAARLLPLEHQNYIQVLKRLSLGESESYENYDDLVLDEEKEILRKVRASIQEKYRW